MMLFGSIAASGVVAGGGGGPVPMGWQDAFTVGGSGSSNFWDGYSLGVRFRRPALSGLATKLRATIKTVSGAPMAITGMSVGIAGGGDTSLTRVGTIVPILFNGNTAHTFTANAETVSDEAILSVGASDEIVVVFHVDSSYTGNVFDTSTDSTDVFGGFRTGNRVNTLSGSGYSIRSQAYGIKKIEFYT